MNDDVSHGRQEDLDLFLYPSKKIDAISLLIFLLFPVLVDYQNHVETVQRNGFFKHQKKKKKKKY